MEQNKIFFFPRRVERRLDNLQRNELNVNVSGGAYDYSNGFSIMISNAVNSDMQRYSDEEKESYKAEMIKGTLSSNLSEVTDYTKEIKSILINTSHNDNIDIALDYQIKNLAKKSIIRNNLNYPIIVPIIEARRNKATRKIDSAQMNLYIDDFICSMRWNSKKSSKIYFVKPKDCPDISVKKLNEIKNLFCKNLMLDEKNVSVINPGFFYKIKIFIINKTRN